MKPPWVYMCSPSRSPLPPPSPPFLKSRCIRELSWNFLNNANKYPSIAFFLQSSRCVSNEQSCFKTTGLYDDVLLSFGLFHFFYFIFSAPTSFSLCFPIYLFFVVFVLSQALIKHNRKAFAYTYVLCII